MPRKISNRERAEIQLESILNEPEVSLPTFTRRTSDQLSDRKMSIEEVSKLLNTQPFILERLVNAIYKTNTKELNKNQIQKLTRVLNGTMDVRSLLFFMMLDEANDGYITTNDLSQFYEKYLKDLKTFDNNRLQDVIQVLLQKFHLDQVKKFKIKFKKKNLIYYRNHELILKNFFQLFQKIQHYLNHYHNLLFIQHGLLNQSKKNTQNFNDFFQIFVGNKQYMNNKKIN
jgi:hypothetical protein